MLKIMTTDYRLYERTEMKRKVGRDLDDISIK